MKGFFRRILAKRFLAPGRNSGNVSFIRQYAEKFTGKEIETIHQILYDVRKMTLGGIGGERKEWSVDKRRITRAEQILKQKEIGSCGDAAVVFAQLARAKGIPVRLVDTVRESYAGGGHFEGHVFADVFVNNKWITVEPIAGRIIGEGYNRVLKDGRVVKYLPFAKGLDFSSMGTATLRTIRRKSARFWRRKQ